jgi:hypothetical protein
MNFLRFNVLEMGLNEKSIFLLFYVKTETLNDRQYYYKKLGTGMDQFGVHMHFL